MVCAGILLHEFEHVIFKVGELIGIQPEFALPVGEGAGGWFRVLLVQVCVELGQKRRDHCGEAATVFLCRHCCERGLIDSGSARAQAIASLDGAAFGLFASYLKNLSVDKANNLPIDRRFGDTRKGPCDLRCRQLLVLKLQNDTQPHRMHQQFKFVHLAIFAPMLLFAELQLMLIEVIGAAMRTIAGRLVEVDDADVYVEATGRGHKWVIFEAGPGCGRTCWDPLVDRLQNSARLVAYDRSGFGRSTRTLRPTTLTKMSEHLESMIRQVVPERFVLVAHSMGGPIARLASVGLADRLDGLLLIDPMPEKAPAYDHPEATAKSVDRKLASGQSMTRFVWVRRLATRGIRRLYPADTYETMVAEDFTPAGISQTRREMNAAYTSMAGLRQNPPAPPSCPVVVLSATRGRTGHEAAHAGIRAAQRSYAESLPHGVFRDVDSATDRERSGDRPCGCGCRRRVRTTPRRS